MTQRFQTQMPSRAKQVKTSEASQVKRPTVVTQKVAYLIASGLIKKCVTQAT